MKRKLAISGISGFTGRNLHRHFQEKEWEVIGIPRRLTQDEAHISELAEVLAGYEVIINLSGSPIIARHSEKNKRIIWKSRIDTTRLLVRAIEMISPRPAVFLSASAVGIYKAGTKNDEFSHVQDEGFIGQLCAKWENEALKASVYDVRTIILRSGIILGKDGGIVKRLLPFFRKGLGATILPASSPFPWIHIRDFCDICEHFIHNQESQGIYNIVANARNTQKDFAKAFAKATGKPLFLVMPGRILKLFLGGGADIVMNTPEVIPARLLSEKYNYKYSTILDALENITRKRPNY